MNAKHCGNAPIKSPLLVSVSATCKLSNLCLVPPSLQVCVVRVLRGVGKGWGEGEDDGRGVMRS